VLVRGILKLDRELNFENVPRGTFLRRGPLRRAQLGLWTPVQGGRPEPAFRLSRPDFSGGTCARAGRIGLPGIQHWFKKAIAAARASQANPALHFNSLAVCAKPERRLIFLVSRGAK